MVKDVFLDFITAPKRPDTSVDIKHIIVRTTTMIKNQNSRRGEPVYLNITAYKGVHADASAPEIDTSVMLSYLNIFYRPDSFVKGKMSPKFTYTCAGQRLYLQFEVSIADNVYTLEVEKKQKRNPDEMVEKIIELVKQNPMKYTKKDVTTMIKNFPVTQREYIMNQIQNGGVMIRKQKTERGPYLNFYVMVAE